MARYREKPQPIDEVEAILYTGDNAEEIKNFLGECFIKIDTRNWLWYKPNAESDFGKWLVPLADMIVKYSDDSFGDIYEDDFLEEWEEVE